MKHQFKHPITFKLVLSLIDSSQAPLQIEGSLPLYGGVEVVRTIDQTLKWDLRAYMAAFVERPA